MPIQPISQLMRDAQKRDYAIGYFESWNLESLQGVLDAACQAHSPVIVGFNGEFLCRRPGANLNDLPIYAAMGIAAAAEAGIPCGFIFNECSNDAWIEAAIAAGFNLVMPADPAATLPAFTPRVARLTALAHLRGGAVDAEIDELPCGDHPGANTDPETAASFVAATGVDLLAVSVGNEHIQLRGRATLDLARLEAIRRRVDIPLVLHGGTGIDNDSLQAAIHLGVRKVNYGTYIKQHYLRAIRAALSRDVKSPHALLGDGSETDIMVVGRCAVRDAVLERIELLGSCDQAAPSAR
jgi:fructose/tagatose bisphosphate aldolase